MAVEHSGVNLTCSGLVEHSHVTSWVMCQLCEDLLIRWGTHNSALRKIHLSQSLMME